MDYQDNLTRFLFENYPVRGSLVLLGETWREVLRRRPYPVALQSLLGQGMAAAALLSSTIKFQGQLSVQLQSQGALSLLVVQYRSDGTMRGLARWQEEALVTQAQGDLPLSQLCADGTLAITIDPGVGGEQYQGLVTLDGQTLTAAFERYFLQSEQLPTRLVLYANSQMAAGLMVQRLPGEMAVDDWQRLQDKLQHLDAAMLLEHSPEAILWHLYGGEQVRHFSPQALQFQCGCSRERIVAMLKGLGYEEIQSIIAERGQVEVNCQFCGLDYCFDRIDATNLFHQGQAQEDISPTRH